VSHTNASPAAGVRGARQGLGSGQNLPASNSQDHDETQARPATEPQAPPTAIAAAYAAALAKRRGQR